MISKLELIREENDVFKILPDGKGFIGIVYHPETGVPVKKFHSGSEQGIRMQLMRYVYTTIPMSCEEE